MSTPYILDDQNKPVMVATLMIAAHWAQANPDRRIVGLTETLEGTVSTVFLMYDHGWGNETVLFETALIGSGDTEVLYRYSTYEDALAGHQRHVAQLTPLVEPEPQPVQPVATDPIKRKVRL